MAFIKDGFTREEKFRYTVNQASKYPKGKPMTETEKAAKALGILQEKDKQYMQYLKKENPKKYGEKLAEKKKFQKK